MEARTSDPRFEYASNRYSELGFAGRVGFGSRPVIIHIDLANAWTKPGSPMYCDNIEAIIESCNKLSEEGREARAPIIYATTGYTHIAEAGHWIGKIPALASLVDNPRGMEIDERLERFPNERILVKKRASVFAGTGLSEILRGMAIDTVIITGVTASACVRHTAEDAIAGGFRPVVVREAIGDRIPGSVESNLFDIDAKFADVVALDDARAYLRRMRQTEILRTEAMV